MKKVLIVYNQIFPYRVPIFNILAKEYDLTVTYSLGPEYDGKIDFELLKLPIKKFKKFVWHSDSLYQMAKEYDAIIGYGDISWLSIVSIMFRKKRKYKVILWGIGVRASYENEYGSKTIWDKARYFIMKKADAVLFYSKDPIPLYVDNGFKEEKLFVANNTVEVLDIDKDVERKNLLFIGTLYKQKRIYELLNSYLEAISKNPSVPILEIIGHGDEYDNVKKWISENKLDEKIILHGKVYDESLLKTYFNRALACISPGQAGLSVLKSMGYGVPFITKKNAITGGEIFNIQDQVSGILYEKDEDLTDIILDITTNNQKYIELGQNAKKHYGNHRKPDDMAQGFRDAIQYVLNSGGS